MSVLVIRWNLELLLDQGTCHPSECVVLKCHTVDCLGQIPAGTSEESDPTT